MASESGSDSDRPVLVLFRRDLRLADNRALQAAAQTGKAVIAAFVLESDADDVERPRSAWSWWLSLSLKKLASALESRGARLVLRRGEIAAQALRLVEDTKADMVLWNRRYDPAGIEADTAMKSALGQKGVRAESFDGHLLIEPWRLETSSGGHYRVYSPFWRAMVAADEPRDPVQAPGSLRGFEGCVESEHLRDWALEPSKPDWAADMRACWEPGEDGAHGLLETFLDGPARGYGKGRDVPGRRSTSWLSPHLAHGEITPFQIWHACARAGDKVPALDLEKFRKELAWREFSYHLLFHNPRLASENFNESFDGFAWRHDVPAFQAWTRGRTGFPIVDAGMRELWQTGWMHNRVRMVTASFLIKHLLVDWRRGEKWFWDTLVDADPANNAASWQWVAGSGADAAPYFRIFNPTLQGEKFDPDGRYVRRYVPELAEMPDRYIHRPWDAPDEILAAAGVKLGRDYPVPVVDHSAARERALQAYKDMRGNA